MSKRSASPVSAEDKKRAKFNEYQQFLESPCQSIDGSLVVPSLANTCNKDLQHITKKFDEYKRFVSEPFSTSFTKELNDSMETENFDDDKCEIVTAEESSTLAKDLAYFVTFGRPMTKQTNLLLKVLHKNGIRGIPKSYEKLMGTPTEKVIAKDVAGGGTVFHYGIVRALQFRERFFVDCEEIHLDVGVDGSRIFNSSTLKIWPIMAAVSNRIRMRPFLVGCYEGRKDPKDSSFMDDFCAEIEYLKQNDIQFTYGTRKVKIRLFCTDAPARALLCSVKGHSSHDGCPFCIMKYRIWDGKVVFGSEIGPTLRTDESFSSRRDPEHHRDEFKFEHSRLQKLFGMVSQFPPDPMHAIDLNVVKDKLESIKDGTNASEISERMVNFQFYRPSEFARDCRSLEYLKCFKATEFRQFLYYGCIAFLKDLVEDHIYYMWLLLHCAVRLLSNEEPNVDQAEVLLTEFVRLYPAVYGENSVTYCVHMLLHMPLFVLLYGPLDSFSAYKFENFIQRLKKYVGSAHHPLQQIFNRIEERNLNFSDSDDITDFDTVQLGLDEGNSFFAVKNNKNTFPVKIVNIIGEDHQKQYVKVVRCMNLKSLYAHPMDSAQLGELSYENLSDEEETFPLSDLCWKYCRIPYEDKFALLPILHSSFHRFQK